MQLDFPIWIIGTIVAVLMSAAAELGYHVGLRSTACDSGFGAVKASVLTLVGLMLAFSYSIAAGHYDRRVQVVVGEAKALKTCWLRTELADEPARSRARELLRSIVDRRLEMIGKTPDPQADQKTEGQISDHKKELWTLAAVQLHQSSEPVKHALWAQSVNDLIDSGSARSAANVDRVPPPVIYLLIAIILVAGFLIGLSSGQDNRRIPMLWAIVIILMVVVLMMIFDLDNPGRGLIADRGTPLEEVKAVMEEGSR